MNGLFGDVLLRKESLWCPGQDVKLHPVEGLIVSRGNVELPPKVRTAPPPMGGTALLPLLPGSL